MRRRDERTAKSLMEQHILGRGEQLIQILEERGLWDDQAWDDRKPAS